MEKLALYFLVALGCTFSLEIYNDNPKNGIIYDQSQIINVKVFHEYLCYVFDVSTVQYIVSWKDNIHQDCNASIYHINFDSKNITWNFSNPEPDRSNERTTRVTMELYYHNLLNSNLDSLNNSMNESKECLILSRMSENFNKLNYELNKLANLNLSSLNEVINLNFAFLTERHIVQGNLI